MTSLYKWRYSDESDTTINHNLKVAMEQQNNIGWQPFLEGWTAVKWEFIQRDYYDFLGSRQTGKHWVIAIIKKLWIVSWDLWEHHNVIRHKQINTISEEMMQNLNRKVTNMFNKYYPILSSTAVKYLFAIPLRQLLKKDWLYKENWLKTLAPLVDKNGSVKRSRKMLSKMRKTMRLWLQPRRH